MRVLSHLCVLAMLIPAGCHAAEQSPIELSRNFYAWVEQYGGGGLPSKQALKSADGYFSHELTQLLHAALIAEARCVKNAPPDMKPPLFEGNLFVTNEEGFSKIVSIKEHRSTNRSVVQARLEYSYLGPDGRKSHQWTDRLILGKENSRWIIQDIAEPKKSPWLLAALKKYNSKDVCGI